MSEDSDTAIFLPLSRGTCRPEELRTRSVPPSARSQPVTITVTGVIF
jgi:hypothetical protein